MSYDLASGYLDLRDEGSQFTPRLPGRFLGGEVEQVKPNRNSQAHFMSSMWVENWLETKYVWIPDEPFLLELNGNGRNFLKYWLKTAGRLRIDRLPLYGFEKLG